MRPSPSRASAALALLALTSTLATACGGDSSGTSTDQPEVIEVTFQGGSVSPNGERVEVQHGQPIELKVTADAPGEIHVHSEPEQELAYGTGTTTLEVEPIEVPGIVDVESHSLEKTIVQLEVR